MDQWRIGPIVWGSLFIWIGVMKILGDDVRPGVPSIGAGVILLGGALWRRAAGKRAGFVLSAMGVLLVLLGLNDLNGDDRGIPLFSTALIAIGALIITKAIGVSRSVRRHGVAFSVDRSGRRWMEIPSKNRDDDD